jgi:phosphate transport system substrate-binding protein
MHRVMTPNPRRLATLAVVAMFAVGACGGTGSTPSTSVGDATGSPGAPSTAPLSGDIVISGSSTVQPISQGVAERFNEIHPDVAIRVDGPGTGDGFQLFCAGDIDISDASRAIREAEAAACAAAGIEYIELKVAIDGLSVLTATPNDAVTCLSYADLYALIGPEAEGVDNWNSGEALARELGSTTDLPDAELRIFGPGEESGTYDYFVADGPIGAFAEDRGQEEATRKDYSSSPQDNVIIEGISGFDTSLGWVGYAFAIENAEAVRLLEVSEPGGECVAPTAETIASNDYPLSRDLFIYVDKAKAAANEALAAFVDFYLADGTIAAVNEEVGYVDLAPDALAASRAAWEAR